MMNFSKMTIGEIGRYLNEKELKDSNLAKLRRDSRAGVAKLLAAYLKKKAAQQSECERICALLKYEQKVRASGYTYIAGVDEAGRGPLAGPVVAAAVILPERFELPDLDDSKKLTAQKREELYEAISRQAVAWSIGTSDVEEIDSFNILQATKIAMRRALYTLPVIPDYILLDALELETLPIPQQGIIGGDRESASIAAASIMAKVTRDRLMQDFDRLYPGYGFVRHKGYATEEHRKAIATLGLCPLHRLSFTIIPAENI